MTVSQYLRTNQKLGWVTISLILFAVVLSVGITLAIQNHNDRVLSAQIEQSESALRDVGAQIADIKDHQFGTMSEYIEAYARIEPLLTTYDQKLQQFTDLCSEAQQREQRRSLFHTQRWYSGYHPSTWRDSSEIIELVRQVNEVMKKEASVIRDMSSLPEKEQVQFWHEEFMPLAAREHAFREQLLSVGRRASPERAIQ